MLELISKERRPIGNVERDCKVYKNSLTGSHVVTYLLHTDRAGNKWWTWENLFDLPMIRQMAARNVIELYGAGLSLQDITAKVNEMKLIVKNDKDPERYEKVYAKLLEMDNLARTTGDVAVQSMGLCTVYLMLNDELPDVYNQSEQALKFTALSVDIGNQAFFLNWWVGIIEHYGNLLKGISRIVSMTSQS